MDVGTQRTIEDRATELAVAVAARDLASVRVLTDPDHWERSAAEDYEQVLPHVRHVEILGALFRRSLMLIEAPGLEVSRVVFEHLWDQREPPLLADQRLFTLVDRAEIERAGDADKLARLRTKLEAQDAAAQLVDALSAHDAAAAAEAFDQTLARWHEHDARLPIESIRTAELLGSVGPRTLVRIQGESDQTIEYLWRRAGDGMLVAGARVFERS